MEESSTSHVACMRDLLRICGRKVTGMELAHISTPSGTPSRCSFTIFSTNATSSEVESSSACMLVLRLCSLTSLWRAGEHAITGRESAMSSTCNHSGPLDGTLPPGGDIEGAAARSMELASMATVSSLNSRRPIKWRDRSVGPLNWKEKSSTWRLWPSPSRIMRCITSARLSLSFCALHMCSAKRSLSPSLGRRSWSLVP
mmetsp:Transcript_87943/g.257098  ORF Transcript_87943/g.257098 Transcript_87943/m.257098 type:complete len:200 (+) Transcript_87943:94-693(+)